MNQQSAARSRAGVAEPWYTGITTYMWVVLAIASLGWVFDVFEGQVFVASMEQAMPSLLPAGTDPGTISFYNNIALGAFLVGGALGGAAFGMLSDRIGRTKTMTLTILIYSAFTCVTSLAQTWWQMAGLRFLVALGVGGEWAVASAMVAEVFPNKARANVGSIFHGTSVLGTVLAVLAGVYVIGNSALGQNAWRWGFALGALPALLTLWIRWKLREPEQWIQARRRASQDATRRTGRLSDLFTSENRRSTFVGVGLAAVGLATFWGVHIYGKNFTLRSATIQYLQSSGVGLDASADTRAAVLEQHSQELKRAEMMGMLLTTMGGGLGLFAFGPICTRLGRRGAFLLYQVGGLAVALLMFQALDSAPMHLWWVMLPVFGFLTLGMHAGYAVYFPELYPTRLRGTGAGFCFNVGRILAAPILFISGWMQRPTESGGLGMSLENSASILSLLFLLGIALLIWAPETKGKELPE